MMKTLFYLLILAVPTFVYSQSLTNAGSSARRSFEFKPEVTMDDKGASGSSLVFRSFTAKVSAGAMELGWSMAIPGNNHIIIERSLDGHSFDAVGTINSKMAVHGNYFFTDHSILHCTTWYRLRQTDDRGDSIYSATVSVSLAREKTDKIFVYPNSSDGIFGAVLPLSTMPADYTVAVYNQLGQLAEYTTDLADGTILLQMDNQPVGTYTLVVEAAGQTYVNNFEKAE